jgi:glucose-6-phosphate dehydrogenase assembly protein OpcA
MAYKILAQLDASAATMQTLYTVPASTATVASSLTICNRTTAAVAVRIVVQQAGAALANKQYIAYDLPVAANDSIALSIGMTLATTDVVGVYASSASSVSFGLFGYEVK